MSIIALFRRVTSSKIGVAALSLALLGNACNSSGAPTKSASGATGGTSSKGGAGSKGGSAGTGAILELDEWVPTDVADGECSIVAGAAGAAQSANTPSLKHIGCRADFDTLASVPLNTSIPGSTSAKVVFDQQPSGDTLYFQNSKLYQVHYDFASKWLSVGQGLPDVGSLLVFNQTEYSSPDRRFLLAAVTYYEGPKYWALEFAPYDTATAPMIEKLFRAVKANAYFGPALVVHPTSNLVELAAKDLPEDIHVKTTSQIFKGIDYQPLNLGETIGKLHFVKVAEIESDYVGFRDIVVLDAIPGDISVTAGIITAEFQTPLSHINVLAMNRKTPNMGLREAMTNPILVALDGKWVRFKVGSGSWSAEEVSEEVATDWWIKNAPTPVTLPDADLTVRDLRNIEKVTEIAADGTVTPEAIRAATLAFGAKSANYSVLANTPDVPVRKAFGVPIYYYMQFMRENGFDVQVNEMLADPEFKDSLAIQDQRLTQLRTAMLNGTVSQDFQILLYNKLKEEYPNRVMRFRTSTNAEDLNGFPCAGCYDSHSGDPDKWADLLLAIKETWSGVWFYRTFRERAYNGIDHLKVGMGLLVHHNFDAEEANGVAITQNIFVCSGLDPAFYVNVQYGGEIEVVRPPAGTTSDEFLYYLRPGANSMMSISQSNQLPAGKTTVLSERQAFNLALALDKIHNRFNTAYGFLSGNTGWYAMDVEFKFDNELDPAAEAALYIKQARPYPDPCK